MSETQTTPVAERTSLLRGAALAATGLAAASLLAGKSAQAATTGTPITLYFSTAPGTGPTFVQIPGTGDTQVLNYALAAETLEAELYRQAVLRLTTGGTDMFGQNITGLGVTGPDVTYLQEFAIIEAQHRDYLTAALQGNWVTTAKAKFDFGFADTNNFGTPALSRLQTVELVYAAELTGVSAYLGAIPLFNPAKTYLSIAAAILGTEARHTAFVAATLNGPPFNLAGALKTAPLAGENNGRDTPLLPDQVLNQGGKVALDNTVAGDGQIGPISGPKGFGGKGFVFV